MSAIDFSNLDSTLGAYFRNEGRILYNQMFNDFKSAQHIDVDVTVKDESPMVTPTVKDIVQVGKDDAWNPTTDGISHLAEILKVRPWQVDLKIVPLREHRAWTARLLRDGSDPYEYPFERFILEKVVMKVKETMERIVWQAAYNSGTAAGAGLVNPLEVCDGFKTLIAALITATTITPVATGAVTSANAVAKFEQVFDAFPEEVKQGETKIFCSYNSMQNYWRNYRDTYPNDAQREFTRLTLDGSEGKCEIVQVPGLSGSGRLVGAPRGILQIGTDLVSDMERLIIEKEKRALNVMMDGKIGAGISATAIDGKDYLIVNDQA